MLRIIETFNNLPASFIVDETVQFLPGQIATLKNPGANYFDQRGTVCRGVDPIGIIDDIKNGTDDSTLGSNRMTIWNKNMIVETDMFEVKEIYHKYSNLFCSENGLLTTKMPNIGCQCVGFVLREPTVDNCILRFFLDLKGNVDVGKMEKK